jgi:hypothetical protein
MKTSFDWTLTQRSGGAEINVTVDAQYNDGERACTSGHPDRWTPGADASVEFVGLTVEGESMATSWDAACARFYVDEEDLRERVCEAVESDDSDCDRDDGERDCFDDNYEAFGMDAEDA